MTRSSLLTILFSTLVAFVMCGINPPNILLLDESLANSPIAALKLGLVFGVIYGIPIPFAAIAGRYGFLIKKDDRLFVFETFFQVFASMNIGLATGMFFWMNASFVSALTFAVFDVAALYGWYRLASWFLPRKTSSTLA